MVQNVAHLTTACGMTQSESEPTLFMKHIKHEGTNLFLMVLVWVDDLWVAFTKGSKHITLLPFLKIYREKYTIKSLGPVKRFIGIQVEYDEEHIGSDSTIKLVQREYITNMIPKFLSPQELITTEELPAYVLDKEARTNTYTNLALATDGHITTKPFLPALASCLYATCMTRPDAHFNIVYLSRLTAAPTDQAWDALCIVMRYLWHTRDLGITYGGSNIRLPPIPSAKPPLHLKSVASMHGFLIVSDASWKTESTYVGFFVMYSTRTER